MIIEKNKKDFESESQPMTATKRLLAGLPEMADLELVGDDGIRVPALRCVLACSSRVMRDLFYGGASSSAPSSVVKIGGCSSRTLRALVEFCCCDELNASIWDASCPPKEIIRDVVALARVAHDYGIHNVEDRVLEGINPLIDAIPPLACVVFNFADPMKTENVYKAAMSRIQENPNICLQDDGKSMGGMVCLSPQKVKALFQDTSLPVDELFLFQQLLRWRAFNENRYPNTLEICKELVGFVNLAYIDPNDIKATVLDSELVDDRNVINALLEQSIAATREGLAFAAMRGTHAQNQIYAKVQNAGTPECNGFYKQIQVKEFVLCFGKKIDEKRMMLLVKDEQAVWKICDRDDIYYEWRADQDGNRNQFPVTGWMASHPRNERLPTPAVRWYRPRGKSPRLQVTDPGCPSPRSTASVISPVPIQLTSRIPTSSPGEMGLTPRPDLRSFSSTDGYVSVPPSTQAGIRTPVPKFQITKQQTSQQYPPRLKSTSARSSPQIPSQTPPKARAVAISRKPATSQGLGFPTMASLRESISWTK